MSVPENENETGWLYQPLASGGRWAAAAVTSGAALSILIVTDFDAVAIVPSTAEQDWLLPLVSLSSVVEMQPLVAIPPITTQATPTFERYQPLSPCAPVNVYEISGPPAAAAVETITPESTRRARPSEARVLIRRRNGVGRLSMSSRFPSSWFKA